MTQTLPYGGPAVPVMDDLSPRERDILEMVCDGWGNADIAEALGATVNTVAVTMSRLLVKMQARNRAHAAALAIRGGIIEAAA